MSQTTERGSTEGWMKKAASLPEEKRENLYRLRKTINFYCQALNCDILSASDVARIKDMRNQNIEEFVLNIHTRNIKEQERTTKNGRKYTLWASKVQKNGTYTYVTSKTYDGLIEKLFSYYTSDYQYTLNALFKGYLKWKKPEVSGKTLQEYDRIWKKYYEPDPISKMNIMEIPTKEWRQFFRRMIVTYGLTASRFADIRSVAFGIMNYCLDEEIIDHNPLSDIYYKNLPFKKEAPYHKIRSKAFTSQGIESILAWCDKQIANPKTKSIYPLAIKFNLRMGLRFAEMNGLRWKDIDFAEETLTVSGQSVLQVEMDDKLNFVKSGRSRIDHVKAYEPERMLPLPPDVKQVLEEIKKLGLSDEFVFPNGNFRYHTYSGKIKEAAKAAGLNPDEYHTHCLRATAGTNAYLNSGGDIQQAQLLLGHTNSAMTSKYISGWKDFDNLKKTLNRTAFEA